MLVLSRKLGEKIYIGDQICITVDSLDDGLTFLVVEVVEVRSLKWLEPGMLTHWI